MRVLLYILILIPGFLKAQVNHKSAYQKVLRTGTKGKLFAFDRSAKGSYDHLELVYLGTIQPDAGKAIKVVTSRWYWGLAPRGTSRIVLFDLQDRYLGDYNVNMTYNVPRLIKGRSLVFVSDRSNRDCEPGTVQYADFSKGIPKHISVNCTGEAVFFDRNLEDFL